MADLQIGTATYRVTRKMSALRQFDVAAKIGPLLASGIGEFVPLFMQLRREGFKSVTDIPLDRFGQIITPVARELSRMTNEDRRFLVSACLDVVDRKEDGKDGWGRVWNAEANVAMFQDVESDLSVLIRLVLFSLQETLGAFFPGRLFA
jgi:hypothetical protein